MSLYDSFNKLFPVWAILISLLAFYFNEAFQPLQSLIVPLLALVMFMMGLSLSADDFKRVLLTPKPIAIGVILQFLLMPLAAITLASLFQLSTQLTAGMVLVGSCAGGTASNVICYLARGDVALSISMTMVSTFIGVIATPLLCTFYLSQSIDVDTLGMLLNIIQVVLVPVAGGIVVNNFFNRQITRIEPALPTLSVIIILVIIAIIVALNSSRLLQVGLITLVAVILHNTLGLMGGFYLSRLLGLDLKQSRTIAIEVGMQNAGLGAALAVKLFPDQAGIAIAPALYTFGCMLTGTMLARMWASQADRDATQATDAS